MNIKKVVLYNKCKVLKMSNKLDNEVLKLLKIKIDNSSKKGKIELLDKLIRDNLNKSLLYFVSNVNDIKSIVSDKFIMNVIYYDNIMKILFDKLDFYDDIITRYDDIREENTFMSVMIERNNIEIEQTKIEDYSPKLKFDFVFCGTHRDRAQRKRYHF